MKGRKLATNDSVLVEIDYNVLSVPGCVSASLVTNVGDEVSQEVSRLPVHELHIPWQLGQVLQEPAHIISHTSTHT